MRIGSPPSFLCLLFYCRERSLPPSHLLIPPPPPPCSLFSFLSLSSFSTLPLSSPSRWNRAHPTISRRPRYQLWNRTCQYLPPHILPPLRSASTVIASGVIISLPFLLLLLLLLLIIILLTKKYLIGHAKELHSSNVNYVIVIILIKFLLLNDVQISVSVFDVVLWFLV